MNRNAVAALVVLLLTAPALAEPPPPVAGTPIPPAPVTAPRAYPEPGRAVVSNALFAAGFLLLAVGHTALIPIGAVYGTGEPFGILLILIPLGAIGAIAFTVAGALFANEAAAVGRPPTVAFDPRRFALVF